MGYYFDVTLEDTCTHETLKVNHISAYNFDIAIGYALAYVESTGHRLKNLCVTSYTCHYNCGKEFFPIQ